jgi:hypothetical protein
MQQVQWMSPLSSGSLARLMSTVAGSAQRIRRAGPIPIYFTACYEYEWFVAELIFDRADEQTATSTQSQVATLRWMISSCPEGCHLSNLSI